MKPAFPSEPEHNGEALGLCEGDQSRHMLLWGANGRDTCTPLSRLRVSYGDSDTATSDSHSATSAPQRTELLKKCCRTCVKLEAWLRLHDITTLKKAFSLTVMQRAIVNLMVVMLETVKMLIFQTWCAAVRVFLSQGLCKLNPHLIIFNAIFNAAFSPKWYWAFTFIPLHKRLGETKQKLRFR